MLRSGSALALAFLVSLAAVPFPGATAQAPPGPIPVPGIPGSPGSPGSGPAPGAASVRLQVESAELKVGLDSPAATTVTVTNTASPTGLPADQPRRVTLELAGVPDGWTAGLSATTFSLGPGAAATASLTVAVSGSSLARGGTLTLTARMEGTASGTPLAGFDPGASDSHQVNLTRADSPARAALEAVGPYAWVALLLVVALAVAVVAMVASNRRVAVRLSCAEPQRSCLPGDRASFAIEVHNLTRRADSLSLRVEGLPEGWAGFLPTPHLELAAGASEELAVVVLVPADAAVPTVGQLMVTARSALAPRRPAAVKLEVMVEARATRRQGPKAGPRKPAGA